MKSLPFFFVAYCCLQLLHGQPLQLQTAQFPVGHPNQWLRYPFAGGFNAPLFSEADLNRDGIRDMVVFERTGGEVRTFLGTGTAGDTGLLYAPAYAQAFPQAASWMLLRDFDQDGAADLFLGSKAPNYPNQIQVFKGYYQADTLRFAPVLFQYPGCGDCPTAQLPYTDGGNNWYYLYSSQLGIPAIADVDQDGDTDILAFEPEGEHLYWYKNKAKELSLPPDSLLFELASGCWGKFADPPLSQCTKVLSPSNDSCAQAFLVNQNSIHPGSSVTALDVEGDGDHDLLLGSLGTNCLTLLQNGGTAQTAWITQQDSLFPHYDTPVNLFIFPAAHPIDADLDGQNDVLVAPCGSATQQDWNNVWLYRQQNHLYHRESTDFMVGEMLDFGTGAHPVFTDQNKDGLMDMVVGNLGQMVNNYPKHAKLVLYLNKGTAQQPQFELEAEDWLGFTAFLPNDFDFRPAFGDLDHDGDDDVVVGNAFGQLYFVENQTNNGGLPQYGMPVANWSGIDVGVSSAPFIVDLDNDGLNDLLVGERTGNINYFRNIGTLTQPQFEAQPTLDHLGGIQLGAPIGHSSPVVLTLADSTRLLVSGSWQGRLFAYPGIVPTGDTLLPLDNWADLIGQHASPTFADLDNDGYYEAAVGIQSGGIKMYKTGIPSATGPSSTHSEPTLASWIHFMPNPAHDRLFWEAQKAFDYQIADSNGKIWAKGKKNAGQSHLDIATWPAGIYFFKCVPTNGEETYYKFIISTK